GDHHAAAVPGLLQPVADDRLGLAAGVPGHPDGVDVGGIDQVEPAGDEGVEDAERRRLVDRPPEHVAAEGERADLDPRSPECPHRHGEILLNPSVAVSVFILYAAAENNVRHKNGALRSIDVISTA